MEKSEGNCYFCGKAFKPGAMRRHILESHGYGGDEPCRLFIAENMAAGHHYWMIGDAAPDKAMSTLDKFLRMAWLECCGHMSDFIDSDEKAVGKSRKIGGFGRGDRVFHLYDYGIPTGVRVTFLDEFSRPPQQAGVRLLARNVPPALACAKCGGAAASVCAGCGGIGEGKIFCPACFKGHRCGQKHGLPVTNSPRCGVCGYTGEGDGFKLDPLRPRPMVCGRQPMVWTVRE